MTTQNPATKTFLVKVPEIHISTMRVEAATPEEARSLIDGGDGTEVSLDFYATSEHIETSEWEVEEDDPQGDFQSAIGTGQGLERPFTQSGREVIGTYEMTPGCALVDGREDGEINYTGETKMYWDGQTTQTRKGQRIWIDDEGDEVLESDIAWKADTEQ